MQVTFLAFFLIHLALKWFGVVRNRGSNDVEEDLKKQSITVKQSLSYNISLLCSVSVLGTHCFILLLLFRDSVVSRCDSSVSVFAEVSQSFSWLIVSVVVMKIREKRLVKFPWMLRSWWLCRFILSFAFDAHFITAKHEPLGFQDYADLTGLLASLFLLAPLLLGDQTEQNKIDSYSSSSSPYGNATLFQRITFSWINPLFSLGYKRPLEKDDVPDIDVKDSAQFCSHAFDQKLKTTKEKEEPGNVSSITRFFAMSGGKPRSTRYERISSTYSPITQRQWIFGARQLGLRLRAALISHIYQKGLLLLSQSRQSHTSGEIINYMSVDVQRITDFIWYVNSIWMLPIQIFSAIYILQKHLGLGALAALVTTLMILKLQAWDNQFLNKVKTLRKKEYDCLWKSLRLQDFTTFILWGAPSLISVVTFVTCMLMGVKITAGAVLSALATFQMLQSPIFGLPDLLSALVQSKVSADRIASYLQQSETQKDAVEYCSNDHTEFSVEIENGAFSWEPESSRPTLNDIELKVKSGMKVAICGAVGSGKSSLLSSILGEIQKLKGTVRVSGKQAYVPQSPWILSGTIRDNILFGSIYESEKYERTVKACALIKDFELFSNGDLTEIGERGINMSGSQKQRIQIARAVYQNADIYLLDDPFSAVDAHTGRELFEDCLMGILKDKTVLYVTHQVEFLPAADLILVMQNGRVMQAGKFEELLKQNIGFEVLVGAHNEALDSILSIENLQTQCDSEHNISTENKKKEAKLVQDEETEKGVIGKEVYLTYLTTVKGGLLVPFIILAQSCFQMLQIASNYWMAWTAPPTAESIPKLGMGRILLVYALLAAGSSLCVLARTILVAIGGLSTAETFFSRMLCSIFRAPMSYFDSTPTGRILNRASTDQSVLDLEMAVKLGWCAFSIIQIVGTIFVMSQVAWQVCVIFIPVAVACRPLDNWPNVGSIVFRDLQVRYAEHFPAVLKNITCAFPGGKKIGVVGRTGSGKSTLIQALFRIVEPSHGTIVIDNVDITKIGLHDLRSRLGIIPQDNALFDGTIRLNLDPLAQYTDREMGDVIRAKDEKLDATVVENGENWSVGQRQLVCLGRVLLKKSNILVLDEATASVDSATDGVIQKIINQEFKDRTVVTIAHRIHTVIESDLVLVLSDGRIAEFDSPAKLLQREDSFFSKLIKEYSLRSNHFAGSNDLLS
ncbi:ABC transporter C family member 9 [Arabidopsis thaliana]